MGRLELRILFPMVSFSLLGLQHSEPNGSRRATPTSTFQHRPGHPPIVLVGIVTLSDYKLFSACLHEAKPLTLRRESIDNLPRVGVNPVNVTKPLK